MDGQDTDAVQRANKTFRIAFIHPDLGIGGAERLVVDAAVGLQELGHDVEIVTSHHDPAHCFEPTRDGTLVIRHAQTHIPRHIKGALHLPLAIARQMSLLFQMLVALFAFRFPGSIPGFLLCRLTALPPVQEYDIFIVDQLSTCVPFLRIFTATRVIFYCHFPDKEVGNSIARQKAIERGHSGPGLFRSIYRIPFDFLEEMTMGTADKIMVNSQFTSSVFQKTFFRLARIPRIVYPGIDLKESSPTEVQKAVTRLTDKAQDDSDLASSRKAIHSIIQDNQRPTLISVNRFEAKKNVPLAVDTFVQVQKDRAVNAQSGRLRLILAGGYDYRVKDNIYTLKELEAQCVKHGLSHVKLFYNRPSPDVQRPPVPSERDIANASVVFLPSVPYALLLSLLSQSSSRILLYTPTEEHFGIVPLEAMAAGLPVLATNSGGPMESIVDLRVEQDDRSDVNVSIGNETGTGLLRRATPKLWSQAASDLLRLTNDQRNAIARNARSRVEQHFSRETMSKSIEDCCWELHKQGSVRADEGLIQWSISVGMFVIMSTVFVAFVWYANTKQHEGLRSVKVAEANLRALQQQVNMERESLEQRLASAASDGFA